MGGNRENDYRLVGWYREKYRLWSPIGQTCGQLENLGIYVVRFEREFGLIFAIKCEKMGDFGRKTKKKGDSCESPFWSEWQDLNLRPLPPQNEGVLNRGYYWVKTIKKTGLFRKKCAISEATGLWFQILNNDFLDVF